MKLSHNILYRIVLPVLLLSAFSFPGFAVYVTNMPKTIIQPDGTEIECFITGDEFHHWLHDKDNYTIVFSHKTGYYVYAEQDGENIRAGNLIVGRDSVHRNRLKPGINISERLYRELRNSLYQDTSLRSYPTIGTFNNITVFVRFSDQSEFTDNISTYEGWFNTNTISMTSYFQEVSYNQLNVNSTFYPPAAGGIVVSWQDSHPRDYYRPYNEYSNPLGFADADERTAREHALVANAISAVETYVPTGLNIDSNNDGLVDNVVFVIAGAADEDILWPHKWQAHTVNVYLRGKRVWIYNVQLQGHLIENNVGVICHEFFHSLGAPDLYRYVDHTISPVGAWDVMAGTRNPPQHMNAYMKWKYGNWIPSIPVITIDQTYTLNPATSSTGQAYRINSPVSATEYYVVEYRRKTGNFENSVPGSGLLVWRINSLVNGTGNQDGPPDEVYVYRPYGTLIVTGAIDLANYSAESGRYMIDSTTNPSPFLSDGSDGGLVLSNVGSAGPTISFVKGTSAGIIIDFSTNPYTEGFEETSFPPPYWLHYKLSGSQGFYRDDYCLAPEAYPHSGNMMAVYPNRLLFSGNSAVLATPRISITDIDNYDYNVSFWMYRDDGFPQFADRVEVYLNSTANLEGTPTLLGTINRSTVLPPAESSTGWYQYSYRFLVPETGIYHIVLKAISAAGNNIYIDDFKLERVVFPITASKWLGTSSTEWTLAANWRNGYVPNAARDVIILEGTPFLPVIQGSSASCRDLYIADNASLSINNTTLYIERNGTIDGSLIMNSTNPKIIVSGDLSFNGDSEVSGSSTNLEIDVYGNCTINNTSQLNISNGLLKLLGSSTTLFTCNAPVTQLYNLTIQKNNATVYLSMPETSVINIHGIMTLASTSKFTALLDNCNITCYDDVTASGDLEGYIGSFTFASGTISLTLSNNSFLKDIHVINNSTLYLETNLKILGDLEFDAGYIYAINKTLTVGGDWITTLASRFIGTGSTVTFNGLEDQFCCSANFNNLVLYNFNAKLIIGSNSNVTANSFDYTSGTLKVEGGSFTAYDLADNNIKGSYILTGGTINLTQDAGNYTDLDADLDISGGIMNVYGGISFPCDWAYTRDITVNMSGGLLVFHNNGIGLTNTGHILNLNIIGGMIRVNGSFIINRGDFCPAGGTIELVGSSDVTVSHWATSSLSSLTINKGPVRNESNSKTRSNVVTLQSNLTLTGNLKINAGTFSLSIYTCNVAYDVNIYGTLHMAQSAATLNVNGSVTWRAGSAANVSAGYINVGRNWTFEEGATVELDSDNTVTFSGTENSELLLMDENASFRNLTINKTAGSVTILQENPQFMVTQNMTVNSGNTFNFSNALGGVNGVITVNGTVNMGAGCTLNLYDFILTGTMTTTNAIVYVHHNFVQQVTGTLNIQSGSFILDREYTGNYYNFGGITNLNGGSCQVTNEGIQFGNDTQFHQSGGSLKVGWSFKATAPGVFQPTLGAVEFIGNRSAEIQCSNGNYIYDLVFNKASTSNIVIFSTDVTVNNDLIINNGNPVLSGHALTINNDMRILGGLLSAGNVSDVITVGHDWINTVGPNGFAEGSGIVNFVSDKMGLISTETFNIVNVTKNTSAQFDLYTMTGTYVKINGLLTINSGCFKVNNSSTLDVNNSILIMQGGGLNVNSDTNTSVLRLSGNLTDMNTVIESDIGFNAISDNTVILYGSADQALTAAYPEMYFSNLTVSKSGGKVLPELNTYFWRNFLITSGEWSYGLPYKTKTFNGDLIIESGGIFSDSTGTSNLVGSYDVNLKILGEARFGILNIAKSALNSINLSGDAIFSGSVQISLTSGIVNLNNHTFRYSGFLTIGYDGRLNLTEGSILDIRDSSNLTIGYGGEFYSLASGFILAHVTASSGNFSFMALPGALVGAEHTVFENMDTDGINLLSGSLVDTTHAFRYCYFQNGAAGGSLLKINCQQNLTIWGADFPGLTWLSAYNVYRDEAVGTITFRNFGGNFAGEDYDYDPFDNVVWGALTPPQAPPNLRIVIVGNEAVLNWDAVPDATGYRIYRALNYDDIDTAEEVGTTDGTSWNDESVLIYPRAFYFIKAYIE
jgi:M6 family metalloprotease-like protein